ncbi:hypothetical protein DND47_30575, partial [Pseudomonas syringae pv. syringae]
MELESPFLHVPIETLSKNLKSLKKQLDKELDGIIQSVDMVLNASSAMDNDDSQLNTCLGNIQQRLQQLSSWIGHFKSQDEKALQLLATRLNFAKQLESANHDGEAAEYLNNLRLYRLLVVHL